MRLAQRLGDADGDTVADASHPALAERHVAAADGVVVIRDVQAAGRKRMAAAQFAAGRGIAVGDVLGRPEPA